MKGLGLICWMGWMAAALHGFGQGTIYFNNRTPTGDARFMRPDGVGCGAGVTAGLFVVVDGVASLTPLMPTTTFRTTAASAFFVNPVEVVVPGAPAGGSVTVRMRAWETDAGSFAASRSGAYLSLESNDVFIPRLGGVPSDGSPPIPAAFLNGLQGATITLPEPGPVALGLLGLGILGWMGRRAS